MYDTSSVRVARENPYIRPLERAIRVADSGEHVGNRVVHVTS